MHNTLFFDTHSSRSAKGHRDFCTFAHFYTTYGIYHITSQAVFQDWDSLLGLHQWSRCWFNANAYRYYTDSGGHLSAIHQAHISHFEMEVHTQWRPYCVCYRRHAPIHCRQGAVVEFAFRHRFSCLGCQFLFHASPPLEHRISHHFGWIFCIMDDTYLGYTEAIFSNQDEQSIKKQESKDSC